MSNPEFKPEGSYAKGALGALIGALIGAIVWAVVYMLNVIAGIVGLLIMLALSYLGAAHLLTPTHIFLYQLVWLIPGLLITEWTRTL